MRKETMTKQRFIEFNYLPMRVSRAFYQLKAKKEYSIEEKKNNKMAIFEFLLSSSMMRSIRSLYRIHRYLAITVKYAQRNTKDMCMLINQPLSIEIVMTGIILTIHSEGFELAHCSFRYFAELGTLNRFINGR